MSRKPLIPLFTIALVSFACSIFLGGPELPPSSPDSSEVPLQDLQAQIAQAVTDSLTTGTLTLRLSQDQLSAYVAAKMASQDRAFFGDPQVVLGDQKMILFGRARSGILEANAAVTTEFSVDSDGLPRIRITDAQLGPLPMPQALQDAVAAALDEALTGSIGPAAIGFRLEFDRDLRRRDDHYRTRSLMPIIPAAFFHAPWARSQPGPIVTIVLIGALLGSGCELPQPGRSQIRISIQADGQTSSIAVPTGSTVAQALHAADITVDALDRTEPPAYSILEDGSHVRLIRVEERFRTEMRSVPFDRQILRNELLPQGEERLVQAGVNGQEELTFRSVLEDGVQVNEVVIKNTLITEPTPEIVMLGSRSSLAPITIPGRLVYLSGGNAWLMEASTSSRRLIVSSGDLDGHVLRLSADGKFLLFTRRSKKPLDQEINTLWVAPTDGGKSGEIDVKASNVIHFADWLPDSSTRVAYSTVEPRSNAPGWQANNDLQRTTLGGSTERVLDSQSGGVYGWWGTSFAFSRSGRLAYSRPDGAGIVIQDGGYFAPILKVAPFQTHADWAWTPGLAWGSELPDRLRSGSRGRLGRHTSRRIAVF